MSGRIIELMAGKIPQRAIRYLEKLPYVVTYQSTAVIDFGNTGDDAFLTIITPSTMRGKVLQVDSYSNAELFAGSTKGAEIAIGTSDGGAEVAITNEFVAGTASQSFTAAAGTLISGATPIIEGGDTIYLNGIDATGTPTGMSFASVTIFYFE